MLSDIILTPGTTREILGFNQRLSQSQQVIGKNSNLVAQFMD